LCQTILEAGGYRTVALENGTDLLSTVAAISPALILLDIMMPGIDGLSLCRQLREGPSPFGGPIVICSAKHYDTEKRLAGEVGATAYLEKPFSPERLLRLVQDSLARQVSVRFWGVRGSIPTPSREMVEYGGNTPCVEVRVSGIDDVFIWDGGTGLRELGRGLKSSSGPVKGFLCFSHFHWDHIQGLPFFEPAYIPGNSFTLTGPAQPTANLSQILSGQMASVYFPVSLEQFGAQLAFREIGEGSVTMGGVRFDALSSLHPGHTLMYRLTHGGTRVVYATDNELPIGWKAAGSASAHEVERYLRFFDGADLLIHDAQFTRDEMERRRGWGHSAWPDVLDIAIEAGVKRLRLFHHDPDHSDTILDGIEVDLRRLASERRASVECGMAREGEQIAI
jgi:phosphoribosyl 1,2-cyclic phosphodiesterase